MKRLTMRKIKEAMRLQRFTDADDRRKPGRRAQHRHGLHEAAPARRADMAAALRDDGRDA